MRLCQHVVRCIEYKETTRVMTQICNALRLVQAILQAKAANSVSNSGRCVLEQVEIMSAGELAMSLGVAGHVCQP